MADNTLALGVRVPTTDFGQIAQSRANALGIMADIEKQRRAQEAQNAFMALARAPGFDLNKPENLNQAFATGSPMAAQLAEAASRQQQQGTAAINARTSAGTLQQKQVEDSLKMFGSGLSRLMNTPAPSDDDIVTFAQDLIRMGGDPDTVSAQITPYLRLPPEQRSAAIRRDALAHPDTRQAIEFVTPKPVSHDRGNVIEVVDENPNSATFNTVLRTMPKGAAPQGSQIINTAEGIMAVNPGTAVAAPVTRGEGVPPARTAAPGVFGAAIDQAVGAVVPGARVSSAGRSGAANAAAGGVPTSFHLTDNARDYDSFPNMTLAQGAAALRQALEPQGFQVIYGGPDHLDHVHVEPGPRLASSAPGGAAPIMPYAAPKELTPDQQAKIAQQQQARQNFSDGLATIRGAYETLNRLGAMTSSEKNTLGRNVLASAGASPVGQLAGKVGGTPAQTQRDLIKNMQFTLLNQIKNMEGIGARSLDSNVELKNALNSLGETGQSIETIRNTLNTIGRIYKAATGEDLGLGGGAAPAAPNRGGAAAPAAPGRGSGAAPARTGGPTVSNW
jgi:hypothetical protein